MKNLFLPFFLFLTITNATAGNGRVIIYPAPKGEPLSNTYKVLANNRPVPVYIAKIAAKDNARRFLAVDDILNSADYFDKATFGYFDMERSVTVRIIVSEKIKEAKILPLSLHLSAKKNGNQLTFHVSKPENLTVEINGETTKSLHLFINPFEKSKPKADDPNVIFFGPGIHQVGNMIIGDNKTVYIAGGAIVNCNIGPNEKYGTEPSGLKNYMPRFLLQGNHIRIKGRGILDAGQSPVHAGNFMMVKGTDISIEGIILRNSCGWTIPLRQSENIHIDNIKILGYRANTDGIDVCNSSNVLIENSFIRTNDDLIVVKTEQGEGVAQNITIKKCVLWNPLAHALSLGAELRENVSNVLFTDCDIIHDWGREWTLRVFHSDNALIKNIRFENIRIEESHQLISLWIGKNASTTDRRFGVIQNVIFKDITATGTPLIIKLDGAEKKGSISNILFQRVLINAEHLKSAFIIQNEFVEGVIIK